MEPSRESHSLEMIYWRGILNFSTERFAGIARQAVHRMQRFEASGIFGDDYHHKSLWDEYCHEVQNGPSVLVEDAMNETVHPIVEALIEALPRHEAALLSLSNSQYVHSDAEQLIIDLAYLANEVLEQLFEIAADRDMGRFDPTI